MLLYDEVNSVPKRPEFLLGLIFGLSPIAVTFLVKLITSKWSADCESTD